MLPAHERLDADELAGLERDLRLVVQDQLVALDRGAQLGEQAEAVGGVRVALGRVGGDAEAAALGVVHGDVGALEQPADVVPCSG